MSEDELPKTLLEYMDFAVNWLDNYAYDYADLMLLDNVYDIRGQLFNQVLNSYVSSTPLQIRHWISIRL